MIVNSLNAAQKAEILRETYKKHATELLAIEDGQFKLLALLLGIIGAGASFLAGMKELILPVWAKVGLSLVIGAITLIAVVQSYFRARARVTTRDLLVRCEKALGFFDVGAYVPKEPLYEEPLKSYSKVGGWLAWVVVLVVIAGVGFCVLLWSR